MATEKRAAGETGPLLVAMTPAEFDAFVTALIPAYAADKVAAGQWSEEEALDLSRKMMAEILPQASATPDHAFYTIRDRDGRSMVGVLWTFEKAQAGGRVVHIYDIEIAAEHRRRGHARRALEAVESLARARGLAGIALHVFGHNPGARTLYESLGFETKSVQMFKPLG